MQDFIICSVIVSISLLAYLPFAIRDWGFFGAIFILFIGIIPFNSAIVGVWAWRRKKLDDPNVIKKLLGK